MNITLRAAVSAIVFATSCLPAFAELGSTGAAKKTVVVAGSPAGQAFSEDRPDYLHFKEVVVTREGAQRLKFDIKLQGKIPTNLKDAVQYYIGFDIDSDPATGGNAVTVSNFGQDIGVFISQGLGDVRFHCDSNSVEYKGRKRDIVISGLKVKDDKIVVEVRSELFSQFESFKFFLSASHTRYDHGKKLSDIQVSTTPVTLF
ncbi:MAG: hypothetical protein NTV93_16260 [Verrucomicrobia bacterium]|nr:hypothetical protein [Verrucomicrobiota bacterium]